MLPPYIVAWQVSPFGHSLFLAQSWNVNPPPKPPPVLVGQVALQLDDPLRPAPKERLAQQTWVPVHCAALEHESAMPMQAVEAVHVPLPPPPPAPPPPRATQHTCDFEQTAPPQVPAAPLLLLPAPLLLPPLLLLPAPLLLAAPLLPPLVEPEDEPDASSRGSMPPSPGS
jgi:hypothetical protein